MCLRDLFGRLIMQNNCIHFLHVYIDYVAPFRRITGSRYLYLYLCDLFPGFFCLYKIDLMIFYVFKVNNLIAATFRLGVTNRDYICQTGKGSFCCWKHSSCCRLRISHTIPLSSPVLYYEADCSKSVYSDTSFHDNLLDNKFAVTLRF